MKANRLTDFDIADYLDSKVEQDSSFPGFYKIVYTNGNGNFTVNAPAPGFFNIEYGGIIATKASAQNLLTNYPNGVSVAVDDVLQIPCLVGKRPSTNWLNIDLPFYAFKTIDTNEDDIAEGVIRNQVTVGKHTNISGADEMFSECREYPDEEVIPYHTLGVDVFSSSKFSAGLYFVRISTMVEGRGDTGLSEPDSGNYHPINYSLPSSIHVDFNMFVESTDQYLVMPVSLSYVIGVFDPPLINADLLFGVNLTTKTMLFEVSSINTAPQFIQMLQFDQIPDGGSAEGDDPSKWHPCLGFGVSSP